MAEQPLRKVTGQGNVLEVDTTSPLQILTGFYKGLELIAWPSGEVTLSGKIPGPGVESYVRAKQQELWLEMCGPEKKRKKAL